MPKPYTIIREEGVFTAIVHAIAGDIQSPPLRSALAAEDWAETIMLNFETPDEDTDEDDFEDDGQPSEMQEWHDFDPDC